MNPATTPSIWYKTDNPTDMLKALGDSFSELDKRLVYRTSDMATWLSMYTNLRRMGLFGYSGFGNEARLPKNRLTFNVTRSIIDTMVSNIGSVTDKFNFVTEGGTFEQRNRAEMTEQAVESMFEKNNMEVIKHDVARDMGWSGTGFAKVYSDDEDVCIERIFPADIVIDESEAIDGYPKTMHQHKEVSKYSLIDMFPEFEEQIMRASRLRTMSPISMYGQDLVSLVESWHLGEKGKHIIWISTAILFEEEFLDPEFPICKVMWEYPARGYWGQGIAEIVRPIQRELNYLTYKIHEHQKYASTMGWIPLGSRVNTEQIENKAFAMYEYAGNQPPTFQVLPALTGEIYQYVENLYQKAYDLTGVGQMAATGSKEAGVTAAVAMQELRDVQSARFKRVGEEFSRFIRDIARRCVDEAFRLNKRLSGGYKLKVCGRDGKVAELSWSSIGIKPDEMFVKTYTAGSIADHPAGKLQAAQEMAAIDERLQPYMLELMNDPDVKMASDRVNSTLNLVRKTANEILLGKEDIYQPDAFIDLEQASELMKQELRVATINGEPDEKLDVMRMWIINCQDLLSLAQQGEQAASPIMPPEAAGGMIPGQDMGIPPQMAPGAPNALGIAPSNMPVGNTLQEVV